jgi:SAM-dependent methyltransferase
VPELRGLLTPDASAAVERDGVLDLLGGGDVARSGSTQGLMFSRALPLVYERVWRPAWFRLFRGPFGPDEHELALELLDLSPGDAVLDVACGPGNFTRGFARAVGPSGLAVGLDASATMLAQGVRDTPDGSVSFVRGDAEALPFQDGSFDAVCCFAALNLMADPFACLDECVRVLAPGGRLAVMTSCRPPLVPGELTALTVEPLSGMTVFGRRELVDAFELRGLAAVRQRIAGVVQFVSGIRP